jgi:hypothetical protein
VCSKTCGSGIIYRTRKCDSPTPDIYGLDCIGTAIEIKPCNTQPCPGKLIEKSITFQQRMKFNFLHFALITFSFIIYFALTISPKQLSTYPSEFN